MACAININSDEMIYFVHVFHVTFRFDFLLENIFTCFPTKKKKKLSTNQNVTKFNT